MAGLASALFEIAIFSRADILLELHSFSLQRIEKDSSFGKMAKMKEQTKGCVPWLM